MLPEAISYLLTLTGPEGAPVVSNAQYQLIVPNFPPLRSIQYTIAPAPRIYAYILYEWTFGQAMVPHAFDTKMYLGGRKIFDNIVSGRFTTGSVNTFAFLTQTVHLDVMVSNLRTLVNYFESATFYLTVPSEGNFEIVREALMRWQEARVK